MIGFQDEGCTHLPPKAIEIVITLAPAVRLCRPQDLIPFARRCGRKKDPNHSSNKVVHLWLKKKESSFPMSHKIGISEFKPSVSTV